MEASIPQSLPCKRKLGSQRIFKVHRKNSQMVHSSQINMKEVIEELKTSCALKKDFLKRVLLTCTKSFSNMPNLLKLQSPIIVVGDIHGQFYDLLNIFNKFGQIQALQHSITKKKKIESKQNLKNYKTQYLFMGDYVDRGLFCIEVISLLTCLKVKYPDQIHLLRGNHESRFLTGIFNFRQQCLKKYDQEMYYLFMDFFDQLPLGAMVDKKYFCVHAGISPEFRTLGEIQKVNRFKEPPEKGGVCDLLWSDPVNGLVQKWQFNKNRMCSYFYSVLQAKQFLQKNELKLIIRGHQVQNSGFKYQKHSNSDKPLTLTIFSAPNYCDSYRNKGAVLHIDDQKLNIFSYSEVEHPVVLPNYMNILEWAMPFLAQEITKIFKTMLKLEKSKKKKQISDAILSKSSESIKRQLQLMVRVQLIEKGISQQKLKNEYDVLRQNIIPLSKYSTKQFLQIRKTDQGQRYPKLKYSARVIGPKLNLNTPLNKIGLKPTQDQEQDFPEKDFILQKEETQSTLNLSTSNRSAKVQTLDFSDFS